MNNENSSTQGLPEESMRLPMMVIDEQINATNDEDDMAMLVRDTNNVVPAPPIHHGMLVQMGVSEPSDVILNPTSIDNPIYNNQAVEVDVHQAETAAQAPFAPSPRPWHIVGNDELFSTVIQNATNYHNIQDDRTVLCERETMAEHVESEEDGDSVSTEPVESPGEHAPLDHDIYITAPIIVIDLTQDDDGENTATLQIQSDAVAPPVVIDLTEDDDVNEDIIVHQAPVIQTVDHINSNEQVNQPVNNPPATSSSEATDQNPVFAAVIDNSSLTMETSAHLQVPILLGRTSKRSNSSDEIHGAKKKHIAGIVKPCRHSVV